VDRRGFLGTNASLAADISLLVGIVVALLLTLGVIMAVRRRYTTHRWIQTTAVALNIIQVLAIMAGSFRRSAEPGIPERLGQPYYLVATVHAAIGSLALLFGAFVALRGNELVPRILKFNNYKLWMRSAYGLYMLATLLGVGVYFTWYAAPSNAAAQPQASAAPVAQPQLSPNAQPVAQPQTQAVPMADFVFNPAELVIPAGTTVEWTNQDGAPHTATADDGSLFKSATLASGERFSFRFDTPGEYAYYCELHGSPGGIGMAGTIRVIDPGQAPAQAAAAPAPAATPVGGQPPTTLPLPQELFEQPVGAAAFRDQQAYGDAVELELKLGNTPDGPLSAFLLSAASDTVLPLGELQRDGELARLQFSSPGGERLAGRYARLLITTDPGSAVQPSGQALFEAALPAQAFQQLSRLVGEGAAGPGYAVLLRQQADELARHIELLAQSQAAADTGGMRRHAEHLYNLIAGSRDARFGDLDGDGRSQNPGDGFGLVRNGDQAGYIAATREAAIAAAEATDATQSIATHGRHVAVCADNLQAWAEEARGLALRIAEAPATAEASEIVARLQSLGRWIQRGQDVDGDGLLAPVAGEGGGLVAYEHAMFMAGFGLTPVVR